MEIPSAVIQCSFADIDEFAEAARAWNLEFYQIDRGKLDMQLFQCVSAQTNFSHVKFSRAIEQHGATPINMRTIGVPAEPDFNVRWRNHEVTGEHLMIFPRNGELYSISRPGFSAFPVSITEESLIKKAEALGFPQIADLLDSEIELVSVGRENVRKIATRCHKVAQKIATHHPLSATIIDALVTEEILPLIVQAIARSVAISPLPPTPKLRARAIRKSRELEAANRSSPLTVAELCREIGVSERTLLYAFREEFGISPKEWLMARSLTMVRRELRHADPDTALVGDIANNWGFWHLGQFARDYQRMFGELPSATLARTL